MKVLLIWDEMMEGVRAFELTRSLAKLAAKCNNQYINGGAEDGDPIWELSSRMFYTDDGETVPLPAEARELKTLEGGTFDKIVICGIQP